MTGMNEEGAREVKPEPYKGVETMTNGRYQKRSTVDNNFLA